MASRTGNGPYTAIQVNGRNAIHPTRAGNIHRWQSQHAGPKLAMYSKDKPIIATSIRFAHRSRWLNIRTPSQRQRAANATPKNARETAIAAILPAMAWGREGLWHA